MGIVKDGKTEPNIVISFYKLHSHQRSESNTAFLVVGII